MKPASYSASLGRSKKKPSRQQQAPRTGAASHSLRRMRAAAKRAATRRSASPASRRRQRGAPPPQRRGYALALAVALALGAMFPQGGAPAMGKHQLATRGAASCSKHADCPSGDYCDSGHSCYRCSYITPSECDAVDGDCCSVAFRAQCTANPRGCAGPPPPAPPAPPAPPPPPCTGPLDCPARQYCDFDHTCYNCSYLSGGKCDAVNKDCCSPGFLSQCPSNPMHCPPPPPPPPPPACPSPCLDELQATCGADKGKKNAFF
eukprot:COSAG06_NODE_7845_length_2354_cov_124.351220_2_plen_262_part_00